MAIWIAIVSASLTLGMRRLLRLGPWSLLSRGAWVRRAMVAVRTRRCFCRRWVAILTGLAWRTGILGRVSRIMAVAATSSLLGRASILRRLASLLTVLRAIVVLISTTLLV